jgi:predicted esterase
VLVDGNDQAQWESWVNGAGWRLIAPAVAASAPIDARVQGIEKAVSEAIQNRTADPARIYLGGRAEASAAVFYAISRIPDLWAAAVALGGSPQPAIDSERFYLANFTNVPVLWVSSGANDRRLAEKLSSAGMPLEWRSAETVNAASMLEWLGGHTRPEHPSTVDCETNSPTFARCYWIRMTRFDAGERNDVLPSTRVEPPNTAALNLGGFGFNPADAGPGVLVRFLPEKYSGPLKMGDRIVALDGREISDAQHYVEMMAKITDERPATVLVERGKDRIRLETSIVLPKRAPGATARVQGKYLAEEKAIEIISREVTEMRVTVPEQWVPAVLNWNGVALEKLETASCRVLRIEKELESAAPCP